MKWKRIFLACALTGLLHGPAVRADYRDTVFPAGPTSLMTLEKQEKHQEIAEKYKLLATLEPDKAREWNEEARIHTRLQELTSRYKSPEFRKYSKTLRASSLLEQYIKSLGVVQKQYVESVSLQQLFEKGWQDLSISLRSKSFREWAGLPENLSVNGVLETIQKYARKSDNKESIKQTLNNLSTELQREYGLSQTATLLVFQNAALENLDRYSKMLTPAEYEFSQQLQRGDLAGVGLAFTRQQDRYYITSVWPGSPSAKSGLVRGDEIQSINGQLIEGLTNEEVCSLLWGEVGSEISIGYQRADLTGLRQVNLQREQGFETASIPTAKLADPAAGVGYVHLAKFNQRTVLEFDEKLHDLFGKGMRSLVLDLRGNAGGDILIAKSIAERFLSEGTFATLSGKKQDRYELQSTHLFPAVPLVILVNEKTASSAEMLVQTLKTLPQCVVVGQMTAKKGTVQSYLPLEKQKGAIRLTTATWNGLQDVPGNLGVMPDILLGEVQAANINPEQQHADQTAAAIELARKLLRK